MTQTGIEDPHSVLLLCRVHQSHSAGSSTAGCYGIGFKSGVSRLCRYATVLSRESGSPEFLVALLNPKCQDASGNLAVPVVSIDPDVPSQCTSSDAGAKAKWKRDFDDINEKTAVTPLRWVVENAKMEHGTGVYLQSLIGESSQ